MQQLGQALFYEDVALLLSLWNSLLSYGIVHFLFPSFKWKLCVCGCVMEAEIYVKKFVQNKTQI